MITNEVFRLLVTNGRVIKTNIGEFRVGEEFLGANDSQQDDILNLVDAALDWPEVIVFEPETVHSDDSHRAWLIYRLNEHMTHEPAVQGEPPVISVRAGCYVVEVAVIDDPTNWVVTLLARFDMFQTALNCIVRVRNHVK